MALSRTTRQELESERTEVMRELAPLEKKVDQFKARVAAISAVLAPYTDGPALETATSGAASLRAAIRALVPQAPGLSTRDIRRRLEEQGFVSNGKTPLANKIAGEVWRMTRDKLLTKRGKRYFVTVKEPQ